MRDLKPIEKIFAPRAVQRGSVLMLLPWDALEMVRRCRAMGIRVLGIDAFSLTPSTTQPVMEKSPDYSNLSHKESWTEAEKFLSAHLDSNLYYEVIVSNIAEIYISILVEGARAWRPVQAEHLRDNVYRIAAQPYDRTTESWQFEPGDTLQCENVESAGGPILAATRRAT